MWIDSRLRGNDRKISASNIYENGSPGNFLGGESIVCIAAPRKRFSDPDSGKEVRHFLATHKILIILTFMIELMGQSLLID